MDRPTEPVQQMLVKRGFRLRGLEHREVPLEDRSSSLFAYDRRKNSLVGTVAPLLRRDSDSSGQIAEGMLLALQGFRARIKNGLCHIHLKKETTFIVTQPPEHDETDAQHKDILSQCLALRLKLPQETIAASLPELIQVLVVAGGFLKVGEPTALEQSVRAFVSRFPVDQFSFGEFMERFQSYRKLTGDYRAKLSKEEFDSDVDAAAIDLAAAEYVTRKIHPALSQAGEEDDISQETYDMIRFQITDQVRKDTKRKLESVGIWFSTSVNPHTTTCKGSGMAPKNVMQSLNKQMSRLLDVSQIFSGRLPRQEND